MDGPFIGRTSRGRSPGGTGATAQERSMVGVVGLVKESCWLNSV